MMDQTPRPPRTPRRLSKAKKAPSSRSWLRSPLFKVALALFLFGFIAVSVTTLYFYVEYSRIIDRKLSGEVFQNTAKIYATPHRIRSGQKLTTEEVAASLQRAGFETADKGANSNFDGVYEINGNQLTFQPAGGQQIRLDFKKGVLSRIVAPGSGAAADLLETWLPPELVTNLYDESREKRRIVEFGEIPGNLVNALIAAEDRRFYSHYGLDPIRLVGAVVSAIRKSDRVEGTSTLTQQLARNFFLTLDRSLSRKMREAFIAVLLEQRLTKEQILTMYANEVYLGNRGSFGIHGFGEGAAAYFGKDIGGLTLSESAMMAAIIPSPNAYSPSKYLERAKNRRNIVLKTMIETGVITAEQYEDARNEDIKVAPIKLDASDAPYLVDFIREQLEKDYSDEALINDNLKVYTTMDPALQRAAVEAVDKGLKEALDRIERRNKGKKAVDRLPPPQAALIVLDPRTGAIKAMVGGSNYGVSQYNRITQAFRQPGSIFKPLVFAAAFETAFDGMEPKPDTATEDEKAEASPPEQPTTVEAAPPTDVPPSILHPENVVTPLTRVIDEPTTFLYEGDRTYEPNNFHAQYRGTVTAREALQHSLNVPTIRIAERIGYGRVAEFAKRAGLNAKIKGYPSVALGAFEVTPIEMAGAYTIFANGGQLVEPHALLRVASVDGKVAKSYAYEPHEVIRPELAYLMTDLMEGVILNGTGVAVRGRGFSLPAAGKTGTSRDGWFAGYTKDLLAIAWVGYDDNRDLNLEGAHSALPIWTEFMMKAYKIYPVTDLDAMHFDAPDGVEFARIDKESLQLAGPLCPEVIDEAFIRGTAPSEHCTLHGSRLSQNVAAGISGIARLFGRVFGSGREDSPKLHLPRR